MSLIILAGAGLFGLAVGSFLTVVVGRLGKRQTIIFGRSRCPACGRTLAWRELLPLVSFLIQRGRCRSCRAAISRSYFLIELSTAGLFVAAAWGAAGRGLPLPFATPLLPESAGGFLPFSYYAFLAASAVAISAYDLLRREIPLALVLPPIFAGALAQVGGAFVTGRLNPLLMVGAAALAAFSLFWGLWRFSGGRAMGRGDADISLALTLSLGPALGPAAIVFSFWIGAIYGIIMLMTRRLAWRSRVPFAPFMALGGIAAVALAPVIQSLVSFSYGF